MKTLKNAKHTPGPLTLSVGWDSREHDYGYIRDQAGRLLAILPDGSEFQVLPAKEIEANGYLFAAAPDLLAALLMLADQARPLRNEETGKAPEQCWYPDGFAIPGHALEAVRAALARAEGGRG